MLSPTPRQNMVPSADQQKGHAGSIESQGGASYGQENNRADQPLMASACHVTPRHWLSRRRRRRLKPNAEAAPNSGKGPGTDGEGGWTLVKTRVDVSG